MTDPRLTETLPGRSMTACNRCGYQLPGKHDLQVWQEHDDADRPEARYVLLCKPCADKLIEPHPRLYRHVPMKWNEPCPGIMAQCGDCLHRDGMRCRQPEMKVNGGPGVAFPAPDTSGHFTMAGPNGRGRRCVPFRMWEEVPACPAKEKGGKS